jgi:hypothetical protein
MMVWQQASVKVLLYIHSQIDWSGKSQARASSGEEDPRAIAEVEKRMLMVLDV